MAVLINSNEHQVQRYLCALVYQTRIWLHAIQSLCGGGGRKFTRRTGVSGAKRLLLTDCALFGKSESAEKPVLSVLLPRSKVSIVILSQVRVVLFGGWTESTSKTFATGICFSFEFKISACVMNIFGTSLGKERQKKNSVLLGKSFCWPLSELNLVHHSRKSELEQCAAPVWYCIACCGWALFFTDCTL